MTAIINRADWLSFETECPKMRPFNPHLKHSVSNNQEANQSQVKIN
jgi:hypothetical protein